MTDTQILCLALLISTALFFLALLMIVRMMITALRELKLLELSAQASQKVAPNTGPALLQTMGMANHQDSQRASAQLDPEVQKALDAAQGVAPPRPSLFTIRENRRPLQQAHAETEDNS